MELKTDITILNYLKSKDPCFYFLESKYGLLDHKNELDLFSSFIFHFISQMLSNKVAEVIWNRFKKLVEIIEPQHILTISNEKLRMIGISNAKVSYIKDFCYDVINVKIDLNSLFELSDLEIISKLKRIKGVGEWTAEMICLFNLGRPNIFSYKDVALKRGIMLCHPNYKTLSRSRFDRLKKLYSPYCSYASLYFYKVNDDKLFELDGNSGFKKINDKSIERSQYYNDRL